MDSISIQHARRLLLAAQGLERNPNPLADKAGVLAAIRSMGLLQIDTIHVVARSPYLVLWSRLGDYQPKWLDELLAEGSLFEYWAHAMCFLPIEDYALYRQRMLDVVTGQTGPAGWAAKWAGEHPEVMERVRAHLRENGAVRSADFENTTGLTGGWWNWKDEKNALEIMLLTGEVMVASRRNFQRVYVLRERLLPDWDDAKIPSREEARRTFALRSVHALGIASAAWVPDYYRLPKTGMPKLLDDLASDGLLTRVKVEGLPGQAYVHDDRLGLLEDVAAGGLRSRVTTVLSPFDPLVWDRQRARELFDFDYTIECYTPAAKRRYGYFTLPVLHAERLVGRVDAKAHRGQGLFEVKALHLEKGVALDEELVAGMAAALRRLAAWHGTPEVVVRLSEPAALADLLQAAVA